MKYYLIVGEASGDLHASNLMRSLKKHDENAEFRFFGGDLMQAVGGTLVKHYKDMAYMGFIPVLLHLRTIFRNMDLCKSDIVEWKPDVLILIDYPGFNLKIAKYIKQHTDIPVYYYISPKIWAWKEYRIKAIKRDIDKMLSILPFEIDFYRKHNYPISYVGNPSVDSVMRYLDNHPSDRAAFLKDNGLTDKPIVAILAGSRKQEIRDNLTRMMEVARAYPDYQFVVAGAYLLGVYLAGGKSTTLIPLVGEVDFGWGYWILAAILIVGVVNAVNFTDGIDGLNASITFFVCIFLMMIAGLMSMFSVSIMAVAVAAACMGFLVWNFNPAKVFMGDTGSLFLGGIVCALAFALNMPILLLPLGIVYFAEILSVVLQVSYFKLTHGKRLFKMSPIHHHFEMCGWSEMKICFVFSMVAAAGGLISLLWVFFGV